MSPKTTLCAAALLALLAPLAQAKQRLCIYDPLGTTGEGYSAARDYVIAMQRHGVDLEIKAFIDERVAVEDFRTGQCDAVSATGLRTRPFLSLSTALDSIGASSIVKHGKLDLPASYEVTRRFIQTLSSPKAAELMTAGNYEVGGIIPLGAAYAFVNDRSISTLEAAAGKRVAAMDYDKSQAALIQRVGARPVAADVTNFGTMFNNGNVDVIIAPTIVYKPLELYKGIGTKGGVSSFPLTMLTYQLILKKDKFPEGFGQKSRDYWFANYERVMQVVAKSDKEVPAKLWMEPSPADAERYVVLMRDGRIDMAEKGFYDKKGLKLVKKIRCSVYPEAAECAQDTENWGN
ncbi:MAG TPA: hypothetical protein H9903_00340 [Candidatus Aquabacterium excrementipullorum]|nr:hypothetical protein [Candidatus Aquabacterium excrementipullorum]